MSRGFCDGTLSFAKLHQPGAAQVIIAARESTRTLCDDSPREIHTSWT